MISREIFTSRFCVLVNLCLPDVQQSRVAPGGGVGGVSRVAPGGGVGGVMYLAIYLAAIKVSPPGRGSELPGQATRD